MKAKQLAVNTFAALAVAALMATALAHAGEHEGERPNASTGLVRDVREVTQHFHDVTAAVAAGYVSAGSCESGPSEDAMGVHYVNAAFVDDGVLDVQRPEVLVYEPRDGGLRLVAVEFFVIAEQWDAANPGAPVLGGQLFNYGGPPTAFACRRITSCTSGRGREIRTASSATGTRMVSCVEYTGEAEGRGSRH
jgi:hypothetical protein